MFWYVTEPRIAGGFEGNIWVEATSDGAMYEGLLQLRQQLNQFLLSMDIAPDAPTRMVEETDEAGS